MRALMFADRLDAAAAAQPSRGLFRPDARKVAALSGVPETMLWTLHNRAREAMRPDRILDDPEAVRIYRALDYDYERNFGPPDGSHALRALRFDREVRAWLDAHPDGTVVELGCGLETQVYRCDNGRARWVGVDVPEAMAVRAGLIDHPRLVHVADDARTLSWLDAVDPRRPLFVTAQGLLMYFREAEAAALVRAVTRRPATTLMFDAVPRWFAKLTRVGLHKTQHYAAPPMPWGLDGGQVAARVRRWAPHAGEIRLSRYGPIRGWLGWWFRRLGHLPGFRAYVGQAVCVAGRRNPRLV